MKKRPTKNTTKASRQKLLHATPSELAVHALLAGMPVMDEVVARLAKDAKAAKGGQYTEKQELHEEGAMSWAGFVADIKARGIIEPLVVAAVPQGTDRHRAGVRWDIVDGRHRFAAGKEAGLERFPVKVTTDDPATYILGAVCQRYHWDKGQRAFFALHLHGYLVADQSGKRNDVAAQPPDSIGRFASRKALAASIGVSDDTVDTAAKVHDLFAKDPAAKKKYLPLIYGGVSLQGVLRGDAAEDSPHGDGATRQAAWQRMAQRFERDAKTFGREWDAVEKCSAAHVAEVKQAFTGFLKSLPPALRDHAAHVLTTP